MRVELLNLYKLIQDMAIERVTVVAHVTVALEYIAHEAGQIDI